MPPSTCASPTESLLRAKSGEIQAAEGPGPEARLRAPSPEWAALNWRQPLTSARPWEGLPLLEGKTASKPPPPPHWVVRGGRKEKGKVQAEARSEAG